MVKLSIKQIRRFARGRDVKRIAVENFLMSMGTDEIIARRNLALDVELYKWNSVTFNVILQGINLAIELER